jgi:hypothetical protein
LRSSRSCSSERNLVVDPVVDELGVPAEIVQLRFVRAHGGSGRISAERAEAFDLPHPACGEAVDREPARRRRSRSIRRSSTAINATHKKSTLRAMRTRQAGGTGQREAEVTSRDE